MRIVLTGGGTGGHIYPGLTLWHHIQEVEPESQVLYVGYERGLERGIVERDGVPIQFVNAAPLRRQVSLAFFRTLGANYRGYRQARKVLTSFRPDVVVGTGGFVTLPVVYAAHRLGIPSVIWEANARPGLTNQLCARFSAVVATSFPGTEPFFPRSSRVVITGNPRASEVLKVPKDRVEAARSLHSLNPQRKLILVFAGSRGAETVNEVMQIICGRLSERPDWQLLYATGDAHYEATREKLHHLSANVKVVPFIHDMPSVMPLADVVITRAGGAALAEIASLGIPSILIPSPYVTANHQEENAKRYSNEGAARLLREAELTPETLWRELELVLDGGKGAVLRDAVRRLATPNAVTDLYRLVMEVAYGRSVKGTSTDDIAH